jgi:hypothetical protein
MFNLDANYGRLLAERIVLAKMAGKVLVVGKSGVAHRDAYSDIFRTDQTGVVRFFSTIAAAIGNGTANSGDTIFVLPGHTETLSSATSLVLDVAGINIIGLGAGTDRPTITLDTDTDTTIPVSAANITVGNIIFTANYADIVAPFTLTTAKNFILNKCYFKATATNMNFLSIVDTSATNNAADGLTIKDSVWIEPDTATLSLIDVDADLDQLKVTGNYINLGVNTGDLPAIAIVATGKDLTNILVDNNKVIRLNDANPLLITADTTTANTGIVSNNFVRHLDIAAELLVTAATNIGFHNNYASAAVDKSGFILPAADS